MTEESSTGTKLDIIWEVTTHDGLEIALPRVNLQALKQFDSLRMQLLDVDQRTGPLFMRDLSLAFEATAKLAARIQRELEDAKVESKHQWAKAVLERATEYLKEKGLKDTAELRKTYGDMDPNYRIAVEKVNALRALYEIVNTKAEAFRMAHDDAKKIYDRITALHGVAHFGGGGRDRD